MQSLSHCSFYGVFYYCHGNKIVVLKNYLSRETQLQIVTHLSPKLSKQKNKKKNTTSCKKAKWLDNLRFLQVFEKRQCLGTFIWQFWVSRYLSKGGHDGIWEHSVRERKLLASVLITSSWKVRCYQIGSKIILELMFCPGHGLF